MPIIRNTDVELTPGSVENTYRRILVSPDKGSGTITLGELIVGPGTELAMHTHRAVKLDISSLTDPDQTVRVKDIELDEELTILNDPELAVVRITSRPVEKIEEEEKVVAKEEIEAPEAASLPEQGATEE